MMQNRSHQTNKRKAVVSGAVTGRDTKAKAKLKHSVAMLLETQQKKEEVLFQGCYPV